jgi:hypothetical protein
MLMRVGAFRRDADCTAHDALRDQLVAILPPQARIVAHGWRPWASASFVGARHWFDVRPGADGDAAAVAAVIVRRDWPVRQRFVADAALRVEDGAAGDWRVELLTVED